MQFLEEKWKKLESVLPFTAKLFEHQIQESLAAADNVLKTIGFIAFLAIFISFFGLL